VSLRIRLRTLLDKLCVTLIAVLLPPVSELAGLPDSAGYLVNNTHASEIRDLLRQIRTSLQVITQLCHLLSVHKLSPRSRGFDKQSMPYRMQLEFVTLVYTNASIAMNASPRKRRKLEHFDPHGLVTLAISDPTGGAVRIEGLASGMRS
jgi:hypothetical protein